MTVVVDSSVLLAVAFDEPGAEAAAVALPGATISAVNASEVVAKFVEQGASREEAAESLDDFELRVAPFDRALAVSAGLLRPATRRAGLSLGDRACLALALLRDWPVITADRAWAELDIGVKVQVIR